MDKKSIKSGRLILRISSYLIIYYLISIIFDKPAFPHPFKVFRSIYMIVIPEFITHLPATLLRWAVVFFVGSTSGLFVAVIVGYSQKIHRALRFEIDFFRSLPATVLIIFLLAAFGDGHIQRSLPALYITFFTVLFYVSKSMAMLNRRRIKHLLNIGASKRFVIRHCVYYEILPVILLATRQAISLSFLVAISVELIIGSYGNVGLGKILYDWKFYTKYSAIIGGLAIIGAIGYGLNIGMLKLHKYMVPWMKHVKS